MAAMAVSAITLAAVLLLMLGETALSAFNARLLRARGGVEPPGDVYRVMQWAYPACFVAMAIEGTLRGPATPDVLGAGLAVFGVAKALKLWAITSLGWRWTFQVIVPPGAPLVATGPYRFLRHPNYVAVLGELAGVAMVVWAPWTGAAALVGFGALMRRRIAIEEVALGLRAPRTHAAASKTNGDSREPGAGV